MHTFRSFKSFACFKHCQSCGHYFKENQDSKYSFLKSLVKGYGLRKNALRKGVVLLLGKGQSGENGREFQKMMIGSFIFCTARLDKSRIKNSYVYANGLFGRIVKIVCDGSSCSTGSEKVSVWINVFNTKQWLPVGLSLDKVLNFVEVECTTHSYVVNATALVKCICLEGTNCIFLCLLHEKFLVEAV